MTVLHIVYTLQNWRITSNTVLIFLPGIKRNLGNYKGEGERVGGRLKRRDLCARLTPAASTAEANTDYKAIRLQSKQKIKWKKS